MTSFHESAPPPAAVPSLREKAEQDGYLFFRSLVDQELILRARRDIVRILEQAGWIDAGTDPIEAISSHPARIAGSPEFTPIYDRIQCLESFHTLAHEPGLIQVSESILGQDAFLQPSNIARVIFPNAFEHTTPPHQDYIHIQGTPDVWTAWIPLGDCPSEMGGLTVLAGSHRQGILPVTRSLGAGSLKTDVSGADGQWVTSPFRIGDVIFFHSHTIHQGIPNRSGNRIRLSVDFRYQRASDPIMDKVLGPHQGRLSWEDVYEGWESDAYHYYWENYSLKTVPKDPWPVAND
jgi:ectoine hydroxylase-related dioxygenase (phytanoyl-CoA dioxygenase family)